MTSSPRRSSLAEECHSAHSHHHGTCPDGTTICTNLLPTYFCWLINYLARTKKPLRRLFSQLIKAVLPGSQEQHGAMTPPFGVGIMDRKEVHAISPNRCLRVCRWRGRFQRQGTHDCLTPLRCSVNSRRLARATSYLGRGCISRRANGKIQKVRSEVPSIDRHYIDITVKLLINRSATLTSTSVR